MSLGVFTLLIAAGFAVLQWGVLPRLSRRLISAAPVAIAARATSFAVATALRSALVIVALTAGALTISLSLLGSNVRVEESALTQAIESLHLWHKRIEHWRIGWGAAFILVLLLGLTLQTRRGMRLAAERGPVKDLRALLLNRGFLRGMKGVSRLLAIASLLLLVPSTLSFCSPMAAASVHHRILDLAKLRVDLADHEAGLRLGPAPPAMPQAETSQAARQVAVAFERRLAATLVPEPATEGVEHRFRVRSAAASDTILDALGYAPQWRQVAGGEPAVNERIHALATFAAGEGPEPLTPIGKVLEQKLVARGSRSPSFRQRLLAASLPPVPATERRLELASQVVGLALETMGTLGELVSDVDLGEARLALDYELTSKAGRAVTALDQGAPVEQALAVCDQVQLAPRERAELATRLTAVKRRLAAVWNGSDMQASERPAALFEQARAERQAARSGYDFTFPVRGDQAPGVDTSGFEERARDAYSPARARASVDTGGIVIGYRPSVTQGRVMAIRRLDWLAVDPARLRLVAETVDGRRLVSLPFRKSILGPALAYAADRRPVTVSIIDHRVILHSALLDTALGNEAIAMDHFVSDFVGRGEPAAALRSAMREVCDHLAIYSYAWRLERHSVTMGSAERDQVASLLATRDAAWWLDEKRSPVAVKHEYFDEHLVQLIADSFTADLVSFGNAIRRASRADRFGAPPETIAPPPPCEAVYYLVTEKPFALEPKRLALAGPLDERPFQFSIEMHFPEESKVQSTDQLSEEDPRLQPWTFPGLHWIAPLVLPWVEQDAGRRQIMDHMSQFAIAQRLFRMALDGYLGESFPLERLPQLARELAGSRETATTSRTDP
jgi:hypothetical protein